MWNRAIIIGGMEAIIVGVPAMMGAQFLADNAVLVTFLGVAALVVGVFWNTITEALPSGILGRWIAFDQAAEFLYDLMADHPEVKEAMHRHRDMKSPKMEAMWPHLIGGIKEEVIVARGRREQRTQHELTGASIGYELSNPLDEHTPGGRKRFFCDEDTDDRWNDIEFTKRSVRAYAEKHTKVG